MNGIKLSTIADKLNGNLKGDAEKIIIGVGSLKYATANDITFLANSKHAKTLADCHAGAILIPKNFELDLDSKFNLIEVENPHAAFVEIMTSLGIGLPPSDSGIHATAIIGKEVSIGRNSYIGAYVVIADNVIIGDNTYISPHCYIGRASNLGNDCYLHPRVVIEHEIEIQNRVIIQAGAVIGSDGFGYVWDGRQHRKVPQIGKVIIEQDVEIGANTTIDRAAIDKTIVKAGTKIDNLVQLGHNVEVGSMCLICAQVGVAGSSKVGNGVVLAGQVGIADHIEIEDRVIVTAQTGVSKNITTGSFVSGYPAQNHKDELRCQALYRKLPILAEEIKQLQLQLKELQQKLEDK